MGFTTGFTSGVTLTLGVAYLTVLAHERTRQQQSLYLRSQSQLLTSLLDPSPPPPAPSASEIARTSRATLVETAKDRWNEEIENAVRWVQRTDWHAVRDGMEDSVARLWSGGLQNSRDGVAEAEKSVPPKVTEALQKAGDAAKAGAESAAAKAKEGLDNVGVKAREAVNTGAGTVDAARGAVRDAVSKGIEKGKEAIGMAKSTVGLANGGVGTAVGGSAVGMTDVEKALQQRYEKPNGLDRKVEETLAERYMPIDERDNTVLRGV